MIDVKQLELIKGLAKTGDVIASDDAGQLIEWIDDLQRENKFIKSTATAARRKITLLKKERIARIKDALVLFRENIKAEKAALDKNTILCKLLVQTLEHLGQMSGPDSDEYPKEQQLVLQIREALK